MTPADLPLAAWADRRLAELARAANAPAIARLSGAGLLCERAALKGFNIPSVRSAGGGCRLWPARDGMIALNLARDADRELLPALFEAEDRDWEDSDIEAHIRDGESLKLVRRGRELGLAIAAENEEVSAAAVAQIIRTPPAAPPAARPLVVDLSALWAGPLAAHLLGSAGAEVVKVESRTRPDMMREGDPGLFALLNQDKASVALDLHDREDRDALLRLLATADIVIEAARPRALLQLGIDADAIVRARPGQLWVTITGHGTQGDAANWVAFGDDAGVAGGLAAAMRRATGKPSFVGDAIADPLTGIEAARIGWSAWSTGQGGRYALAMSGVVALALKEEGQALDAALRDWGDAAGQPFPAFPARSAGRVAALGEDNDRYARRSITC